ncbi:hypothetical protein BGX31_005817 [Mortierella sp. GBA43]|nr:hypothetical protein BGX31_005817 [Mortierella sp. GBA43]
MVEGHKGCRRTVFRKNKRVNFVSNDKKRKPKRIEYWRLKKEKEGKKQVYMVVHGQIIHIRLIRLSHYITLDVPESPIAVIYKQRNGLLPSTSSLIDDDEDDGVSDVVTLAKVSPKPMDRLFHFEPFVFTGCMDDVDIGPEFNNHFWSACQSIVRSR